LANQLLFLGNLEIGAMLRITVFTGPWDGTDKPSSIQKNTESWYGASKSEVERGFRTPEMKNTISSSDLWFL
jgi:hypothetical protein